MATVNLQKNSKLQSRRSHVLVSNSRSEINNSQDQSQYQIVVEFELRRQRQKTRILEQRLHNKQVFIQQMKEYQDQLTLAFEKCQQELIISKKTLEQFHLVQVNYNQEIADLKHLIIRLEDEITLRDKTQNKRHYNSVKKQIQNSPPAKRQIRTKTLMHQEEESPKVVNKFQQEIIKESKKISKFIKQFLMMAECFCKQSQSDSLKNRLKVSWKWIKQIVKQWNNLRNQKTQWRNFLQRVAQKRPTLHHGTLQQTLNNILMMIKSK